ncbi:core component of ECF transporter [Shewanella sp. 10N.286.51.B7]|uniref:core component of ECF transporter n=1 Tax=Shewanella sp. 10N.286.51.B7 TaxID=1880836 RepID=UPI000C815241|nr:core component of ECF transporter [Shewanella sp. 10N.286.51.B7]PMG76263.1 core component of ECF transporter [Shewanella sp. 10N.286.51.B7]
MKQGFTLHNALFIGFCATLLVAIKSMMRMKLGLTGHSMFLISLFYLVCYGATNKVGSMTLCGLLTGILAMILGVGKGGPFILLKFALPALAMDLALIFMANMFTLRWRCILLAIIGSIAWASKSWIQNLLVGMDPQVAFIQFGLSSVKGGVFAIAGALLVPVIINRLDAHDLLTTNKAAHK